MTRMATIGKATGNDSVTCYTQSTNSLYISFRTVAIVLSSCATAATSTSNLLSMACSFQLICLFMTDLDHLLARYKYLCDGVGYS